MKIYAPNTTERVRYAIDLVLKQVCLLDYSFVLKNEIQPGDYVINYSGESIENSFQVHPHGLLYENDIKQFDVTFEYGGDEKVKLFLTEFDELGFDIFSASFFLATRLEEYWPFEPDKHGRYTSEFSVASKIGFLQLPLINIWCEILKTKLQDKFQGVELKNIPFKIINTIDVDNAWAFLNKGALRAGGGMVKAGSQFNISELIHRAKVLASRKNDPYDTYVYLKEIQKENDVESIYFFLLGDRAGFDKNVPHTNQKLQNLINEISSYAKIGLHPSYASYLDREQLGKEVDRLKSITNKDVKIARKHFLRLCIPETYRNLEKVGITHDYTMGYADDVGFRASICSPYTFFDVLQDKELFITIHPFAYMDGTLNEYLKLSVESSVEKVLLLKAQVKLVGGEFIGVWHNETINNKGIWQGWRQVYESSLKKNN